MYETNYKEGEDEMTEFKLPFIIMCFLSLILSFLLLASISEGEETIEINCNGNLTYSHNIKCNCSSDVSVKTYDYDTSRNIQAPHSDFDYEGIAKRAYKYGSFFGDSMEGLIYQGHTILNAPLPSNYELSPGEIVRYTLESKPNCKVNMSRITSTNIGMPIVHQVVSYYNDDNIVTAGINTYNSDVIKRCQILDLVIGVLWT